jgi:hypothetical protein
LSEVVAETDGWTGAEMEALVLKAYEVADDTKEEFGAKHLAGAIELYIPTTQNIRDGSLSSYCGVRAMKK